MRGCQCDVGPGTSVRWRARLGSPPCGGSPPAVIDGVADYSYGTTQVDEAGREATVRAT